VITGKDKTMDNPSPFNLAAFVLIGLFLLVLVIWYVKFVFKNVPRLRDTFNASLAGAFTGFAIAFLAAIVLAIFGLYPDRIFSEYTLKFIGCLVTFFSFVFALFVLLSNQDDEEYFLRPIDFETDYEEYEDEEDEEYEDEEDEEYEEDDEEYEDE
jgi:small-conductance mechanosensitive channel